MKLFMDILFLFIIGYYTYKFIQILFKMKQKVILPATDEEMSAIRIQPEKALDFPAYSKQKTGIIIYSFMLLFVIVLFFAGTFFHLFGWQIYWLIFLPMAYSFNLLNMFAVINDGLLCGNRFVAWNKIKSFHFVPMDINNKYYGHSKEVNEGFELKIKTKGFPISCFIISEEMKEKLTGIFSEHVMVDRKESV
ncbi:hypothetical protein CIL03_15110 [Virgibacillus indicus]|uniref:DUF5673 domain-containing protein n=1 Tax=Virgibacillus indicus TaxID=2024554 RepID=A0A265N8B1_9BACI|nr:hypothetical protein [Virgibacillus indicus]OZU87694.1 hypothetical protein CIL03_15110 [Virgibacillus indicus]